MCYGCKLGGTPWSSLDYPFSRCHRCHQGRAQISVTPTQYWQFYTSIFQPDILVHTTSPMPWSVKSNVTCWKNVQNLFIFIEMKLFLLLCCFVPFRLTLSFPMADFHIWVDLIREIWAKGYEALSDGLRLCIARIQIVCQDTLCCVQGVRLCRAQS